MASVSTNVVKEMLRKAALLSAGRLGLFSAHRALYCNNYQYRCELSGSHSSDWDVTLFSLQILLFCSAQIHVDIMTKNFQ
jgi:hypothetical protein